MTRLAARPGPSSRLGPPAAAGAGCLREHVDTFKSGRNMIRNGTPPAPTGAEHAKVVNEQVVRTPGYVLFLRVTVEKAEDDVSVRSNRQLGPQMLGGMREGPGCGSIVRLIAAEGLN